MRALSTLPAAATRSSVRPLGSRRLHSLGRDVLAASKPEPVTPVSFSNGYAVLAKGEPLKLWGRPLPAELLPNEVEIAVTHNGLCHSDLHMRNDDWGLSKFPFIPGHEVVGVVRRHGSQVTGVKLGQRLCVGWIRGSCRHCMACLTGEDNICEKGYEGTIVGGNHGGFQAVLRVPADFAHDIPDGLDSADAAPLLCAGVTVFAPLKRFMTRPAMSVGILGIGGLGHLAVQFAAAMGGVVTAIDIEPNKEAEALKFGAQRFLPFSRLASDTVGAFDLILNTASANVDTSMLLGCLRNGGTLVQIGIPGGGVKMITPLQDLVFGQKRVAGSIVGGRADIVAMLELAARRGVKPMIERFPIDQVNDAFARLVSGKARYRIVLDMQGSQLTTEAPAQK